MQNEKVDQFFESHPQVEEVHEALGVLFIKKEEAGQYLGGVLGQEVLSHTREKQQAPDQNAAAKQKKKEEKAAKAALEEKEVEKALLSEPEPEQEPKAEPEPEKAKPAAPKDGKKSNQNKKPKG